VKSGIGKSSEHLLKIRKPGLRSERRLIVRPQHPDDLAHRIECFACGPRREFGCVCQSPGTRDSPGKSVVHDERRQMVCGDIVKVPSNTVALVQDGTFSIGSAQFM
jgi:hypothetical protein